MTREQDTKDARELLEAVKRYSAKQLDPANQHTRPGAAGAPHKPPHRRGEGLHPGNGGTPARGT